MTGRQILKRVQRLAAVLGFVCVGMSHQSLTAAVSAVHGRHPSDLSGASVVRGRRPTDAGDGDSHRAAAPPQSSRLARVNAAIANAARSSRAAVDRDQLTR
jgi:hypothetical protein